MGVRSRYQSAHPVSISFDFFLHSAHPQTIRENSVSTPRSSTLPKTSSEGAEESGWQAQKSANTRTQITEAAIRCFVEYGYSQTTTTLIAEKAGLSRGAMLHHFPSKLAVVSGAVEHLHAKRLKAFRKAVTKSAAARDHLRTSLDAYWAHVRHPMFVAFFELAVAARTDKELAAILRPAQEAFEREWYDAAVEVFPEWKGRGEKFDLALDLVHYVLEGMAVSFLTHKESERDKRVLEYLDEKIHELAGIASRGAKS
jgi:AcrR family transcriptional regulator